MSDPSANVEVPIELVEALLAFHGSPCREPVCPVEQALRERAGEYRESRLFDQFVTAQFERQGITTVRVHAGGQRTIRVWFNDWKQYGQHGHKIASLHQVRLIEVIGGLVKVQAEDGRIFVQPISTVHHDDQPLVRQIAAEKRQQQKVEWEGDR